MDKTIISETERLYLREMEQSDYSSLCGQFTKHYYNMDMPHLVFCVQQEACRKAGLL